MKASSLRKEAMTVKQTFEHLQMNERVIHKLTYSIQILLLKIAGHKKSLIDQLIQEQFSKNLKGSNNIARGGK